MDTPKGAVLGTSSFRRQCQLRQARPDLQVKDLRGNVGTRLGKLDGGEYDAIILAAAGLIRLEMPERIRTRLPYQLSLPAGGQGAVGIECRLADDDTRELLACLHHADTAARVTAERAVVARLEGGCQVPIASYAELDDAGQLHLRALVGSVDGQQIIRAEAVAPSAEAEQLGLGVAEDLLHQGAGELLAELLAAVE